MSSTGDESEDGQNSISHKDQDSDASFKIDTDEEIDTTEIEEEDWVDYTNRSTNEAIEKMGKEKIRCWNKTHKKMKWTLALRIATSPSERWLIKAAEWNPELSSKYRTNRAIGRPRKRWEDDINEFLKQFEGETENLTESSNHINKNWINTAKDRGRWALLEENYTKNLVTRKKILITDQRGTSLNTMEEFQSKETIERKSKNGMLLFSECRNNSAFSSARTTQ